MQKLIWPALGVLIIAAYYVVVVLKSQNIPFTDDLSILASLYDIRTATTSRATLAVLLSFHNEHRLLLPRLVTLLLTKLNGGLIDFRWWVWVGNGFLLIVLGVFYRAFRTYQKPFIFFIPVVLLLFQPVFTELTYWGMASLQNIGVLALATVVLYMVSKPAQSPGRLGVVGILTGATILTGANGLLLLASVACALLLQRRYRQVAIWLMAGGLATALYWTGFSRVANSGTDVPDSFSLPGSVLSLLGLMGSFIDSQRYAFVSVGIGIVVVGLLGYVAVRCVWPIAEYMRSHTVLFLLAFSSFLLLTLAVIAVNRSFESVLHVSRYKIYPVLLLICVYLLWLRQYRSLHRPLFLALMGMCLLFNLVAYKRALPVMNAHQIYQQKQLSSWLAGGPVDVPTPFMQQYYGQRWRAFYELGLYKPPATP